MIRYLKQKQTEAAFHLARFMMKNHENKLVLKMKSGLAWGMQRRYGKEALDFLEETESADEQF